jgi:hypothetical protein
MKLPAAALAVDWPSGEVALANDITKEEAVREQSLRQAA